MVDEAGVRVLVDSWAAIYDISNTKYQFKSEVDGYVPIQFLDVSYKVDCDALTKEFRERLRTLDAGEVVPEIVCCRNGEPFDIKDTYIEVDITNQKVTFYKDGERIVFTDVVTAFQTATQRSPASITPITKQPTSGSTGRTITSSSNTGSA